MRLALDLDGVVCDLGPGVAGRLRATFGIVSHPSTWRAYDFSHLAIPHAELRPFLDATFADPSLYDAAPVCDGAVHALAQLVDAGWSLVAVTARAPHLADVTRAWLERHRLPVDDVRHAPSLGKDRVARELGADAAVDDHAEEAERLGAVCRAWLFHRPWNASHVPARCERVASWHDVLGRLHVAGRRRAAS